MQSSKGVHGLRPLEDCYSDGMWRGKFPRSNHVHRGTTGRSGGRHWPALCGASWKLFDEALAEAGIDRNKVYVANAVKHFKWSAAERGQRRIHKRLRQSEIEACRPRLEAELRLVQPKIVVCLGATAAQQFFWKSLQGDP